MKRRWKVLIGIAFTLAVLLAVNTVVVDQQTKPAEVTASGGQLIRLPGGEVQVLERAAQSPKPGAPIVLLHCYACSLRWWDQLTPLLTTDHRVIRVDFLGFGGSEKPSSGYSVEDQTQLVAGAMNELDVRGAVVVGQSMGAAMAVSLAESSSQLVDRVVDISLAASNDDDQLPFLARLGYTPVLGEAIWRLTPDFAVLDSFKRAFAPDFEIPPDFEDMILDGYERMTYTSYDEAHRALRDFRDAAPLDQRMTSSLVPLMAIFGAEDQLLDPTAAAEGFEDVPGVRISTLPGIGHTPQVEAPKQTAGLIEEFAADAGDEILSEHPPRKAGKKPKRDDKAKHNPDKKPKQGQKDQKGKQRGEKKGGKAKND
ncbi:MAG: alpha/beta hydrolase [bacterium]